MVSHRRMRLLRQAGLLVTGGILGGLPLWVAWAFFGESPASPNVAACSLVNALDRGRFVAAELVPAMWGKPTGTGLAFAPFPAAASRTLLVLGILIALGSLFWAHRRALCSLGSLLPVAEMRWETVALAVMFVLPLALAVVGTNSSLDIFSMRYLLPTWQASVVILAVSLSQMTLRSRTLALVILGLWMAQLGIVQPIATAVNWIDQRGIFSTESITELDRYLTVRHIEGGYADYWLSYVLDFLTQEKLVFAPFSGFDRYPPYSDRVAGLPVQAYVFSPGFVPSDARDGQEIAQVLRRKLPSVFSPSVVENLTHQAVIGHQRVANWDVWLLTRRPVVAQPVSEPGRK